MKYVLEMWGEKSIVNIDSDPAGVVWTSDMDGKNVHRLAGQACDFQGDRPWEDVIKALLGHCRPEEEVQEAIEECKWTLLEEVEWETDTDDEGNDAWWLSLDGRPVKDGVVGVIKVDDVDHDDLGLFYVMDDGGGCDGNAYGSLAEAQKQCVEQALRHAARVARV